MLYARLGTLISVLGAIASIASAEVTRQQASPLDRVFERVQRIVADEDWTKRVWKEEPLESELVALVEHVNQVVHGNRLRLPTRFAQAQPAVSSDDRSVAFLNDGLFVSRRAKVSHANRSIIIGDESVRVSHAQECLIIARGVVEIGHGRGNMVIAGHYIHSSFDGAAGPDAAGGGQGSLLVSGDVINVSHANETVCCAPGMVSISHASKVTFIDSPHCRISHEKESQRFNPKSAVLRCFPQGKTPIAQLKISQLLAAGSESKSLAIVDHGGSESVLRLDRPILRPDGTPLKECIEWKMVFVAREYALFAKNDALAGVYVPANNE